MTAPFADRLADRVRQYGPLCLGVDPHASLLRAWGLPDRPQGLATFCNTVMDAAAGNVAIIKPQIAFFERHGSQGVAVLESLLKRARSEGVMTLIDAKRGDIGSTMAAYAETFLDAEAPLAGDAVTVSPFLGPGSLTPAADLARARGRGIFVLALTSNPEGHQVQHARTPDGSVAATIVDWCRNRNVHDQGAAGIVVGATVGQAIGDLGINLDLGGGWILAPGVGAQGAAASDLRHLFGVASGRVIAPISRGILGAGPQVTRLQDAIKMNRDALAEALS